MRYYVDVEKSLVFEVSQIPGGWSAQSYGAGRDREHFVAVVNIDYLEAWLVCHEGYFLEA